MILGLEFNLPTVAVPAADRGCMGRMGSARRLWNQCATAMPAKPARCSGGCGGC